MKLLRHSEREGVEQGESSTNTDTALSDHETLPLRSFFSNIGRHFTSSSNSNSNLNLAIHTNQNQNHPINTNPNINIHRDLSSNSIQNLTRTPNSNSILNLTAHHYPEYSNSGLPIGSWLNDEEIYNQSSQVSLSNGFQLVTIQTSVNERVTTVANAALPAQVTPTQINQRNIDLELELYRHLIEARVTELEEQLEEYKTSQQFNNYYLVCLSFFVYIMIWYQYLDYGFWNLISKLSG